MPLESLARRSRSGKVNRVLSSQLRNDAWINLQPPQRVAVATRCEDISETADPATWSRRRILPKLG